MCVCLCESVDVQGTVGRASLANREIKPIRIDSSQHTNSSRGARRTQRKPTSNTHTHSGTAERGSSKISERETPEERRRETHLFVSFCRFGQRGVEGSGRSGEWSCQAPVADAELSPCLAVSCSSLRCDSSSDSASPPPCLPLLSPPAGARPLMTTTTVSPSG